MTPEPIGAWDDFEDRKPAHALVSNVDLVVIRYDRKVSVLWAVSPWRCSDGHIQGDNLISAQLDYRFDTGVSEYANNEVLPKFNAWVEDGQVFVDRDEIADWPKIIHSPSTAKPTLGGMPTSMARKTSRSPASCRAWPRRREGLSPRTRRRHGRAAPSAPRLGRPPDPDGANQQAPLLDDEPVETGVVIGPNAQKPLHLDIPLFVSDMSFGALSQPRRSRSPSGRSGLGPNLFWGRRHDGRGAGGRSRYFCELASAFQVFWDKLEKVQAFHFKGGQAPKPGPAGICPLPR